MTVELSVDLRSAIPVYEQIRSRIAGLIGSETLVPGERLPSVRALAADLGVAVNTVARAYTELESAGLVHARRWTGTVVAERSSPPIPAEIRTAASTFAIAARGAGLAEDSALEIIRATLRQPRPGLSP